MGSQADTRSVAAACPVWARSCYAAARQASRIQSTSLASFPAHTCHSPTDTALRCDPPQQPFVAFAKKAGHQTAVMRDEATNDQACVWEVEPLSLEAV